MCVRKKTFFMFVVLILLMLCATALADIKIDSAHFPDEAFRKYITNYIDSDKNGTLSSSEINSVTEMECMSADISDLTGIGVFRNLTYLNCWQNKLTKLDLKNNTKLEYLRCNSNGIKTLDISSCPQLCRAVSNNKRQLSEEGYDYFGVIKGNQFYLPFVAVDCTTTVKAGSMTSKPDNKTQIIAKGSLTKSIHYKLTNKGLLTIYGQGELPGFSGCRPPFITFNVNNVVIEEGITYLGDQLKQCNLQSVSLPNSLVTIDTWAFKDCTNLTSLTIPDSVKTINSSAFLNCSSLTSIHFGSGVTEVGHSIFDGCPKLTDLSVSPNNPSLSFVDGILYTGKTLVTYLPAKTGKLVVREGTETITAQALSGNTGFTEVVFPSSLKSIGEKAFYECSGLQAIVVPSSVYSIGSRAFEGCTGLKTASLPSNIEKIPFGLFSNCKGLTSFTVPEATKKIVGFAFSDCTGLKNIYIPCSVKEIDWYAFSDCTRLKHVWYGGTENDRNDIKIKNDNEPFINAVWHYETTGNGDTVEEAEQNVVALSGGIYEINRDTLTAVLTGLADSNINELVIPSSVIVEGCEYEVTEIKSGACRKMKKLKKLTIGKNVSLIGAKAFSDCKNLKTIVIKSEKLTASSIGNNALKNISKKAKIKCPKKTLSLYKKILRAKGVPSSAKITK